MSRAIRRQQSTTPNDAPSTRGIRLKQPRPSRGAKPPATQKRRFRPGTPRWLEEIISELKKVTWPSRDETRYLTMVVIIVAVAVGLVLGAVDIFFNWLIDRLLLS